MSRNRTFEPTQRRVLTLEDLAALYYGEQQPEPEEARVAVLDADSPPRPAPGEIDLPDENLPRDPDEEPEVPDTDIGPDTDNPKPEKPEEGTRVPPLR